MVNADKNSTHSEMENGRHQCKMAQNLRWFNRSAIPFSSDGEVKLDAVDLQVADEACGPDSRTRVGASPEQGPPSPLCERGSRGNEGIFSAGD